MTVSSATTALAVGASLRNLPLSSFIGAIGAGDAYTPVAGLSLAEFRGLKAIVDDAMRLDADPVAGIHP